jgi:hypothetical protein
VGLLAVSNRGCFAQPGKELHHQVPDSAAGAHRVHVHDYVAAADVGIVVAHKPSRKRGQLLPAAWITKRDVEHT